MKVQVFSMNGAGSGPNSLYVGGDGTTMASRAPKWMGRRKYSLRSLSLSLHSL